MLVQEDLEVATLELNEKPSHLNLSTSRSDGLGVFRPGEPSDANSLIQADDEALYQAKRNGRNRTVPAGDAEQQCIA